MFGITRQSYYKHFWQWESDTIEQEIIIKRVKEIRKAHPVMGVRKLYNELCSDTQGPEIKIGRDGLFNLLSAYSLLVKIRRRRVATTISNHTFRKYKDLIKGIQPTSANQLWVSDITYWRTPFGFLYISFITDAYSHKIVGYQLADNMEAINNVRALKMALGTLEKPVEGLIHHSDRGMQYCSLDYVGLLKKNNISISMTQGGDPRDNAIAERINGIIKSEYLKHRKVTNKAQAMELLNSTVELYNTKRPHLSNNYLTPEQAHTMTGILKKQWKNYYPVKITTVNQ